MSYTCSILTVSRAAYAEVCARLKAADPAQYEERHSDAHGECLDLTHVVLEPGELDSPDDVRAELEALRTLRRELTAWAVRWHPAPWDGGDEFAELLARAKLAR